MEYVIIVLKYYVPVRYYACVTLKSNKTSFIGHIVAQFVEKQ